MKHYIYLLLCFFLLSSCGDGDNSIVVVPEPDPEPEEESPLQALGFPDTGLPVMVINTPNGKPINSKEDWLKGASVVIYNISGEKETEVATAIKGRGNTTWGYPKKPYTLKLDSKTSVLGMSKHKRWALLANWMDRTLLRNDVSLELGRRSKALGWTPDGRFVELILNGKHMGNYYVCEQIKIDESRVNIAELDEAATEGEEITGGYVMELDVYFDEQYKFQSSQYGLPYMFKDPDEVNSAQFDYMQQYITTMETALKDKARFEAREFEQYMELKSFADWWIINELVCNFEAKHPKSCYVHKDRGGKMVAGPLWDYDWETFTYHTTAHIVNNLYYPELFSDKEFRNIVKAQWAILKPLYATIPDYIDQQAKALEKSDAINSTMWPISLDVNGDTKDSFSVAIDKMKSNYSYRLKWIDEYINNL